MLVRYGDPPQVVTFRIRHDVFLPPVAGRVFSSGERDPWD